MHKTKFYTFCTTFYNWIEDVKYLDGIILQDYDEKGYKKKK